MTAHIDDVVAELASGVLTGPARGEALAHLSGCPACARHVAELAEAADAVLLAGPDSEPPLGFEARVVESIAGRKPRPRRVRSRRARSRRRVFGALAVAAGLIAVAGVGSLLAIDHRDQAPKVVRAAMMRTGDGRNVGFVYASSHHVVLQMSGLRGTGDYRVVATLKSGAFKQIGNIKLVGGEGKADLTAPAGPDQLKSVKVLGRSTDYQCEGEFT